jgi:MerR family transcriptional regulator, light-induced transcriptional regulator
VSAAVEEYLTAISVGDRTGALELVRRLLRSGSSTLDIIDDVVAPAQARVGELWALDAWSVAQEHAATAVSEAMLGVLGAGGPAPDRSSAPVVVTCVEHEWHALPALIVAEHLRAARVPVSYLGANASAEHLVRHVLEVAPRAVALSCSLSASLPRVRKQIEAVRATGTPVVVGGAAFDPEGRRAAVLGATAFATCGAGAAEAVDRLPSAVPPTAPLTHPGASEGTAVHADREEITARLRARVVSRPPFAVGLDPEAGWQRALLDHLPHVVGALAGALFVDDNTVLDDAVTWLDEVMRHREAPDGTTGDVVDQLLTVLGEHPAATRLLSGLRGPAGGPWGHA